MNIRSSLFKGSENSKNILNNLENAENHNQNFNVNQAQNNNLYLQKIETIWKQQ